MAKATMRSDVVVVDLKLTLKEAEVLSQLFNYVSGQSSGTRGVIDRVSDALNAINVDCADAPLGDQQEVHFSDA